MAQESSMKSILKKKIETNENTEELEDRAGKLLEMCLQDLVNKGELNAKSLTSERTEKLKQRLMGQMEKIDNIQFDDYRQVKSRFNLTNKPSHRQNNFEPKFVYKPSMPNSQNETEMSRTASKGIFGPSMSEIDSNNNSNNNFQGGIKKGKKPNTASASKNDIASTKSILSEESRKKMLSNYGPNEIPEIASKITNFHPALNAIRKKKEAREREEAVRSHLKGKYTAFVDLSGFTDTEISLEVEGRRLIVNANRPRRGEKNARKVTEIITIPEEINLDNLKIGRNTNGYLLVEEAY